MKSVRVSKRPAIVAGMLGPIRLLCMSTPNVPGCGTVGPLEVHGQETHALVGEKQVLALWANRSDGPMHHEWRVVSAPAGSQLLLDDPFGETDRANHLCQRPYPDGVVPTFVPDVPGRYVFEVRAFEHSTGQTATGEASIVVTLVSPEWVEPDSAGCSAGGGIPLLCLGLLVMRRLRSPR